MPSGRLGHIGLAKETTFGMPVAAAKYMRYISESLVSDIEPLVPRNITGYFDEGPTFQGLKTHMGKVTFNAFPDALGLFLVSAIGADAITGAGSPYTHKFKVRQAEFSSLSTMTPLTLEVHKDLGNAFQFSGCIVNKLKFMIGVGKGRGADMVLTCEADMLMKTEADITATSPTFETPLPFLWNQAAITLGGTSFTTFQDLSIEIDNGLESYPFLDGTSEIQRILSKSQRVVTVGGTLIADRTQWADFIAGTQQALVMTFTGAVLGGGNFSLEFNMPLLRYYKFPIPVPGPELIMVTFDARAKFDPNDTSDSGATNGTPIIVTLMNDVATAY